VHGFHGLRDHSGFLGPLPLSQQPKSRPFTPMGVESIVAISMSHSRDPWGFDSYAMPLCSCLPSV